MSFTIAGAVAGQRGLPKNTKLLLLMIASYANDGGFAFPSRRTLALDCQVTDRTITEQLGALEAAGWITRTERRRPDGSRSTDLIRIIVAKLQPIDLVARAAEMDAEAWKKSPAPLEISAENPAQTSRHEPINEPVIEPVEADLFQVAPDKPSAKPKAEKRATRLPDDFEIPKEWIEEASKSAFEAGLVGYVNYAAESLKFINFWTSKAGKDGTKLNWKRTFVNWCIKAAELATGRPAKTATGQFFRAMPKVDRNSRGETPEEYKARINRENERSKDFR